MAALETVVDQLAGNYTAVSNQAQIAVKIPIPPWVTESDTPFLYAMLNQSNDGVDLNGGW
jgi:hypothetical protein